MPGGRTSSRIRKALPVVALVAALVLGAAPAAAKKGGGAKTRTLSSGLINQAIVDDPGPSGSGITQSQLTAGRRFKGRKIGDVNVDLRVTHANVNNLTAKLTAPNGSTVRLVYFSLTGGSYGSGAPDCDGGFMSLDDETPFELPGATTSTPFHLTPPYAGTAQPGDIFTPLAVMDGGPLRGTWTLTILDGVPGSVGTLHCWQLRLRARR